MRRAALPDPPGPARVPRRRTADPVLARHAAGPASGRTAGPPPLRPGTVSGSTGGPGRSPPGPGADPGAPIAPGSTCRVSAAIVTGRVSRAERDESGRFG